MLQLSSADIDELVKKMGTRTKFRKLHNDLKNDASQLMEQDVSTLPGPPTNTLPTNTLSTKRPMCLEPEADTLPSLKKKAHGLCIQPTLNAFSSPKCSQVEDKLHDKYFNLRTSNIKVYEERFINTQAPVKKAYLNFWNEECLKLHKSTAKNIEGLVKLHWNIDGKPAALKQLSQECTTKFGLDQPFKKYADVTQKNQDEIESLSPNKCSRTGTL